ncbi:MAG TPA: long-chain-fatty-acid--CoA ligase [Solirubrobacteraceae bacterium]|nr:long-chain-fatty-acid--CoA ligase [Solirubrobacteraceae bacterium]
MYTLADLPRRGAVLHGPRTAVVFEDTRLTYEQLNRRINQAAHTLAGLGLQSGERLTVLSDNSARYLETYLAAAKLGVSVTPLNTRLSEAELDYIVTDSEAVAIVVGDTYEEKAARLLATAPGLRFGVSLDNDLEGFTGYEAALAHAPAGEPHPARAPSEDDLAVLMYTGGTTGAPKGVMLSHRNVMTATIADAITLGFTKEDSTCFVLPIFHVSWWPILSLLLVGGKVVINRTPDLNEILRLIQDERCTHMNSVPTIYGWLMDMAPVDSYDLHSLRSLTYAGSPIAVEVLKRAITTFGPIFAQAYGATETAGGPITFFEAEDHHLEGEDSRLLASAGKAAICSEIKVVGDNGETLESGAIGEVCVRGKHIMMGYWKNPGLTAAALRDGWYHTGDLGYLDERGYLFLTDRKSDMIISGGENVYPNEVENVLHAHPGVLECSVVAASDERWGEIVHAVVVTRDGVEITGEEIIAHCRQTLAGYKCPKRVTFIDSLPKTAIGKVSRKKVKEVVS